MISIVSGLNGKFLRPGGRQRLSSGRPKPINPMNLAPTKDREAHGPSFSLPAMVTARDSTFEAVHRIAQAMRPA